MGTDVRIASVWKRLSRICRHASRSWTGDDRHREPRVTDQQIEIVSRTETTEHQSLASHCAACDKTHLCTIPPWIRKYLRDVYDLKHSRGRLPKVINKSSQAIAPLYEDLFGKRKAERSLNIDETGHRDSGKRMWTWCLRGSDFTVFKIDPSRGSEVLLDVLGKEFVADSDRSIMHRHDACGVRAFAGRNHVLQHCP